MFLKKTGSFGENDEYILLRILPILGDQNSGRPGTATIGQIHKLASSNIVDSHDYILSKYSFLNSFYIG